MSNYKRAYGMTVDDARVLKVQCDADIAGVREHTEHPYQKEWLESCLKRQISLAVLVERLKQKRTVIA